MITKNDVTYERPEIALHAPDWDKVADVVKGERVVKSKTITYLPKPNPNDDSTTNAKRYEQYVDRAVFFNATGRTLEGLIGIAFGGGPDVEVPAAMDFVTTDIDGAGGGIKNQSHRTLELILQAGRTGLLTDYPVTNTATSKAQLAANNIHSTITTYEPKSIINWRLDENQDLSMVVLFESVEEEDGFGVSTVDQWRELSIGLLSDEESGVNRYIVRLWRMNEKTNEPYIFDEFTPLDATGKPWDLIPFTFAGAVDNNSEVDKSPMLDLACLNIAHYRNSADYEESAYFVGQPTWIFSGLDETWVKDVMGKTAYVGSRSAVPLPVGGDAKILEASPNTLAGQAMEKKEAQMIAMGARLLTSNGAIKTAEQSRSETAAAHSVLSLAVTNMASAYTKALEWVQAFTGEVGEVKYTMQTDYVGLNADPNLLNAIVASWQSGAIPTSDKNAAMRQIGMIDPDKSDDDIEGEIDSDGGGLDLDE